VTKTCHIAAPFQKKVEEGIIVTAGRHEGGGGL